MNKTEVMANVIPCVRPKKEDGVYAIDYEDLQIYFRVFCDDKTAVLSESFVQTFGIDGEKLLQAALDNLRDQISIRSLADVLSEVTGDAVEDLPVAVASTKNGSYGAGVMLILNELFVMRNKWVIPCSI